MKPQSRFARCAHCGARMPFDRAKCVECKQWNTGAEEEIGVDDSSLGSEAENQKPFRRIITGFNTIDEMWGWKNAPNGKQLGVVSTSVSLIGGGPGAGKSTMSVQLMGRFAYLAQRLIERDGPRRLPFYIGSEETKPEIIERAKRLGVPLDWFRVVGINSQGSLKHMILKHRPNAIFLDSLAGMTPDPYVIVETTKRFKEYAEALDAPVFLIQHATKKDEIAGLLALQHGPDVVMTLFAIMHGTEIRELASLKSRHGPSNYSRYLLMTGTGLIDHELPEEEAAG